MAHRGRKNADDLLAAALATGATVTAAAVQAGVSPRTAQRRLADPAFRAAVGQQRATMLDAAYGTLSAGLSDAATKLRTLLDDADSRVALAAAAKLLDVTLRVREHVSITDEVEELQRRLDALDNAKTVAP